MKQQEKIGRVQCLCLNRCKNYTELTENLGEYNILTKKEGPKGMRYNVEYIDLVCSFDIETSSFIDNGEKRACMYTWQFSIDGKVYVGRKWEEYMGLMSHLEKFFNLTETRRLIVWVHNLSYEFAWICNKFKWSSVFAREKNSPFKANTTTGFEFRCSYVLSGMSLAMVSKNLTRFDVKKMVGDLDYKLVRGPETPLTDDEMQYCINDCLVVTAYIWEQIDLYGDMLKLPMTNTGRVRKMFKESCFDKENYYKTRRVMKNLTISSTEEYMQLKRAFQGGFTHCNYLYNGYVIEGVQSMDFTSSYPTVMIAEAHFPMSRGERFDTYDYTMLTESKMFCFVFDISFTNIRPKLHQDNPISFSKCRNVKNVSTNNGRVMSADYLETTITDLDLRIIQDFYEWDDVKVGTTYRYSKGYLPKFVVEIVISLYEDKTTLKDVEDKVSEYMLKKGALNSTFGMMVTDIMSALWDFNGNWNKGEINIEEMLAEYNDDNLRYLFYPWGVFITALARYNLFTGIKALGDDYIYADTDSVKYMNPEKHQDYFDKYNEDVIEKLKKACNHHRIPVEKIMPKTVEGVVKPLGVWDFDGYYERFCTLGAKRYLVEVEKDGERHIKATVAGVNKKGVVEYLEQFEDPFEHFNEDLVVPAEYAHKTQHFYIEHAYDGITTDYLGNEFNYSETSGIYMTESKYDMKISETYAALLMTREYAMF